MTRLIALAGLLTLAGPLQAQLLFDPPAFDLGGVKAGQVFDRTAKVTNAGKAPFIVRELKSSCGCLTPTLEPMTLAPGQVGVLRLRINTLSNQPGPQGWRIVLNGIADGQPAIAEQLLRAEVVQEIAISPSSVTLYGGKRRTEHTFAIVDQRAKPLRIVKVEASSPLLQAGAPPTLAGQPARGDLKLTILEGFAEGRHEETVTLTTDDAEYPKLQIPVTVIRKPSARFTALPNVVMFNRASEATSSRLITIRDAKGEGFQIERIEAEHPSVTAEVVRLDKASASARLSFDRTKADGAPARLLVRLFIAGEKTPTVVGVQID